jgi:hypothetical protein
MGWRAGYSEQGGNAVAVGNQAGQTSQGAYAIAVGYRAGYSEQGDNSIILNATNALFNSTTASSFHVKPVRGGNYAASALAYTSGGEIVEETNMHFDTSGRVGIGTTSPVSSLHIATTGDFSISNTADKSGVNERIGRILFYNGTNLAGAAIESCVNVGGANNNADIRFMTSYDNNTKLAERMRIDRAGNVGINQTTPLTTLDISGGFQSYSGRHVKTVPIRHNAYNDVAGNGGFVRVGDVVPGQGAGYSGSFAAFSWFGSSAITHGTGDRWNTPNRIRCCWRWGFVQGYVANVTFKLWETLYSTGDSLKATIASSNGSLSRGFTTVWGPPMTMIRGDVPGLKIEADSNTSGNASAPIRISDIWFEYVYV